MRSQSNPFSHINRYLLPFLLVSGMVLIAGSCSVTDNGRIEDKSGLEQPPTTPTPGNFTKETFDIYLLIGQSNMAGRGELNAEVSDTLQGVFLFNGENWEKAANPLNKYSTSRKAISMQKLGPGYTFSQTLAIETNRGIGLVVNARGGTNIDQWQKGYYGANDEDLYEGALERIKKVSESGSIKAIIWHQGESNQNNTANYLEKLNAMVSDFRADLELPQLHFIAGELGKWRTSSKEMNALIQDIPRRVPYASYVVSDGLTPLNADSTDPHFDNSSQQILGVRYAQETLKKNYP